STSGIANGSRGSFLNQPGVMEVLRLDQIERVPLISLLSRYGLSLIPVAADQPIPGSYWGEPEAGLIGNRIYARGDTPLHSVLHECCHYICMPHERRANLHTDAGGNYAEENGVCYLQILLAGRIPGVGRARMCHDMDAWGYSFRLGSAERWFREDADDALAWLRARTLVDERGKPATPGKRTAAVP